MKDFIVLLHPAIASFVVFPLIGISTWLALQVRSRRLDGDRTTPATVGKTHVQIGKLLTGVIIGIVLFALGTDIANAVLPTGNTMKISTIVFMFVVTIAALVGLYRAKNRLWRAVFATLTGIGLVIIGCQDGVWRNTAYWYVSHYYYGMVASLLMIFALAILPDIYRDRRWRTVHIVLNCIALLIFVGQTFTGSRSLLEIPLSWQKPYVQQLYQQNCEVQTCVIQPK